MENKSTISFFISISALIISALSFYNSARKYDDATIFINKPQVKIINEKYEKTKDKDPLFSSNKSALANLSIRLSVGVINNGTRPFAINNINFIYYSKSLPINILNTNKNDEQTKYMKDNPEQYCNNEEKFYTSRETLGNFDTIIVKPGDAQVSIKKNINATIANMRISTHSFILVCMPVSVIMADGSQELNSKIWFIVNGKIDSSYDGDKISLSVEWPKKGITLIQSPSWKIW